jgi:outer membrane protein assembly factor BamB
MGDDGFAGPAVADGRVFIVDHEGADDVVRALDLKTGSNVWTYSYADSQRPNYGFARSTPAIDQGKVYTVSRMGVVNCLDAPTGAQVWSKNVVSEFKGQLPGWQMSMSPLVDGNRLIVCPAGPDASVAALDKLTGRTIWAGGGSQKMGYSTPVAASIGGRKQYIVFAGTALTGVDAAGGRLLWSVPWQTSYDVNAATPIVIGDTVFVTSGYARGCALVKVSGEKTEILWENKDISPHFNSPVFKDGYFYGSGDGPLVCMEAKTGKVMWKQPGFEKGGLVGVDGCLIAVNGGGGDVVLLKMSPDQYTELGRMKPLGGQSWTAPIVADGKLIIRNKSALACLNLK